MSKNLRRYRLPLIAVFLTGTLSAALAGCGTGNDTDTASAEPLPAIGAISEPTEPVTLQYYGAALQPTQAQAVIDAFEAKHPNIRIEYNSVPYDQYNTTLTQRFASGDVDIFDVDQPRTAAYDARGWLADLTPVFRDETDLLDQSALAESELDGQLLNVPTQVGSTQIYYNKKLLSAAGIPFPSADPTAPITWEQVRDSAKKAQEAGARYGLTFSTPNITYYLQPLAESAGGGPGATGEKNLEPAVDNEGWSKALNYYGGLYADGISPRGVKSGQTSEAFANGDAAFFFGGVWNAKTITANQNLDFGVAPTPIFAGGTPASTSGGWALGLNPNSSRNKQEAAALFFDFYMFEGPGFLAYTDTDNVPPTAASKEAFWSIPAYQDPRLSGTRQILDYESANTAKTRVQTVGYVEFEDIMTKAIDDIINGSEASARLTRAQSELDEAWQQYR